MQSVRYLRSRVTRPSKPPWTVTTIPDNFLKNGAHSWSYSCACTANALQKRTSFNAMEMQQPAALVGWKSAHRFCSFRCFSAMTLCSNALSFSGSRKLSREFGTAHTRTMGKHLVCTPACSKLPSQVHKQSVSLRGLKTDHFSPSFVNPLLELQKFVSVPILSEHQEIFSPSEVEVAKGVSIFSSPGVGAKHAASFVGSFVDGSALPDSDLAEVCFLGRSNVGKSSLIGCILNAQPQVKVRVSRQPGHTKTLNLYRVGRHFFLVDMPGYGHNMPRNFQLSVETYLNSRRRLCRTFLLVDGEVGLTSTDHTALDMLQEFGIPFVIVLTKIDKAGRHKLLNNLMSVMEVCRDSVGHTCFPQPFLVSSKTGDGVMLLQTFIAYITGCVQIKGL